MPGLGFIYCGTKRGGDIRARPVQGKKKSSNRKLPVEVRSIIHHTWAVPGQAGTPGTSCGEGRSSSIKMPAVQKGQDSGRPCTMPTADTMAPQEQSAQGQGHRDPMGAEVPASTALQQRVRLPSGTARLKPPLGAVGTLGLGTSCAGQVSLSCPHSTPLAAGKGAGGAGSECQHPFVPWE